VKVESVYHAAVAYLGPDASLSEAAGRMRAGEFGSIAIFEGDRLAGILSETDLVRALADHRDRLNRAPGEADAERSGRFQA